LDVSGSMTDTLVQPKTEEDLYKLPSKLTVAKGAFKALVQHLLPQDRIGLVIFNEEAKIIQDLTLVESINKGDLLKKVEPIQAGGGTVLSNGMEIATKMLLSVYEEDTKENRIIFLTDMCDTSEDNAGPERLLEFSRKNATLGIFASFIGVGVDFDTTITEKVSRVRGSNYFCIFSPEEFNAMLSSEFNYNFFPVAYDVELRVDAADKRYVIENVYGTPYAEELVVKEGYWTPKSHCLYPKEFRDAIKTLLLVLCRNGLSFASELISHLVNFIAPPVRYVTYINTCFPSPKIGPKSKGGLILIQLKSSSEEKQEKEEKPKPIPLQMQLSYRSHWKGESKRTDTEVIIEFPTEDSFFSSEGVKKGIFLQKYAKYLKSFLHSVEQKDNVQQRKTGMLLRNYLTTFKEMTAGLQDETLNNHLLSLEQFVSKNVELPREFRSPPNCSVM